MDYLTRIGGLSLVVLASCTAETRTREPVVSSADGKTSVSDAGTAVAKRGKALFRLVNAVPAGRTIDLTGDDRTIFYDVAYRSVTPYTEIGDNVVKFRVLGGGTDSVWSSNTETLVNGNRYTAVALPKKDGGVQLLVFTDEVVPDQGKARVRVVHAAPVLPDVDVAIEGRKEPLFDDVAFGTEAGFKDVDPAASAIVLRRGDPAVTTRLIRLRLEPGKSYTIVIAGSNDGVEAITVTDAIRTYAVR